MSANPPDRSAKGRPTRRGVLKSAALGAAAATVSAGGKSAEAAPPVDLRILKLLGNSRTSKDTPLKRRAAADYRRSMEPFGGQLSCPPEQLLHTASLPEDQQFDVVIIGSGYGAAMCAAALAPRLKPGLRLAIIERGREWTPGHFPDTRKGLRAESRARIFGPGKRSIMNPLGLHNVIMNSEVNVWTGNGLGGGSLINAGITKRPDPEVFSRFKWPTELSNRDVLEPWYQRVSAGLHLMPTPWDMTSKVRSRRRAADALHPQPGFFQLSPMSLMYDERLLDPDCRNPQGMIQRACTLCGDCITGCNIGAKNTLAMNYLPLARAHGAEIYTQVEVQTIEKLDGRYRLNVAYHDDRCGKKLHSQCFSINSRLVIVAAGSPGSPEILLKSCQHGLCMSKALGHRWTGNGDTLGFIIKKDHCSKIGGVGAYDNRQDCIGPTVQSSLNFNQAEELERRFLIQDAAIPRAATNLFRMFLRDIDLDKSGVMLGMGHDGAIGRVEIDRGTATIRWPGLKDARFRQEMWQAFERIARAEGGKYKKLKVFGDNLVTVHPLGGCATADDPMDGVVNAAGQVFDGTGGGYADQQGRPAVHKGLYVADGSIIPSSLGCNPLLTISALAMRIADGILANPEHQDLFDAVPLTARAFDE